MTKQLHSAVTQFISITKEPYTKVSSFDPFTRSLQINRSQRLKSAAANH